MLPDEPELPPEPANDFDPADRPMHDKLDPALRDKFGPRSGPAHPTDVGKGPTRSSRDEADDAGRAD